MKSKKITKNKSKNRFFSNDQIGIIGKPKGHRYFSIIDQASDQNFKLNSNELKKAIPGDLVSYSLTEKSWAVINKTLKSNTLSFLGNIEKRGKVFFAQPFGLEGTTRIKIIGEIPNKILPNSMVKIEITSQPKSGSYGEGIIKNVISESNILAKASELAISNHELREGWSNAIIKESKKVGDLFSKSKKSCRDLREKAFVTIDGKTAKDFDDAVYSEKDKDGSLVLYVAIADVARFVKPQSDMDQEAFIRGTSVYFTQKVIPMLPEVISNDLCSLRPQEDKFCLVCKTKITEDGKPYETSFFEAIINSKARLTYEQVAKSIDKNDFSGEHAQSLKNLMSVYKILKKSKKKRGALELDIPFYVPSFKGEKIDKFINTSRNVAHLLIEECMLFANICAAQALINYKIPSMYRIHPQPDALKIKNLESFIRSRKINAKFGAQAKVKELSKLIEETIERKDKETIHMQILQSLGLAIYDTEVSEHFALGYPAYTHFTSPIRRYPDLMVHRALKALISTSESKEISIGGSPFNSIDKELYPYSKDQIEDIASESSKKERVAEKAEREAVNYLKCEFASENIGKEFQGTVTGVTNFGLFIHLDKIHIEGLCHIKYLPKNEYYEFDEQSKMLISNSSKHSYSLGDQLYVKIKSADLATQRIDIEILK